MLKIWIKTLIVLLLIFPTGTTMDDQKKAEGYEVTINKKIINIREGPGLSYPIAQKASAGEVFTVIGEKGEWYEVKLKNRTGWIAHWLVKKVSSPNKEESETGVETGVVLVESLRVRTGPGTTFQIVGSLKQNQQVQIVSRNENWLKVKSVEMEGWASAEFIEINQPEPIKEKEKEKESDSQSGKSVGIIKVKSLNFRAKPSLESDIIGKLTLDTKVEVIKIADEWLQVQHEGKTGWVHEDYIEVTTSKEKEDLSNPEDAQKKETLKGGKAIVTAQNIKVRATPSFAGKVISTLKKGHEFKVLDEENNWIALSLPNKETGWIPIWYVRQSLDAQPIKKKDFKNGKIVIIHDGTLLRKEPSAHSEALLSTNEGDTFPLIAVEGDWYKIALENDQFAYVAGWIVSSKGDAPQITKSRMEKYFTNRTIVLDPGHGGRDNGTTGSRGTLEKALTLRTAQLLSDKIRAAGGRTVLTRIGDTYVTLRSRASSANYHNADAFISIHYDSSNDSSVNGITTYYYHPYQKDLADEIHSKLISGTSMKDRNVRKGDYHVIRENGASGILLELGYLSNPAEEMTVLSSAYQEAVSEAIFNGLAEYFIK
ncbi:SH3 domain-containing protein [Peribacillus alkalitolerans]|uniref:SH3 domain-containing protein n=1 Tax=Peribacillus alkalitolerans TaxID=1550385 RepID=UPI0013D80869|nr:SH3 domain-containing protein [Peribacillus alkalitolerans]